MISVPSIPSWKMPITSKPSVHLRSYRSSTGINFESRLWALPSTHMHTALHCEFFTRAHWNSLNSSVECNARAMKPKPTRQHDCLANHTFLSLKTAAKVLETTARFEIAVVTCIKTHATLRVYACTKRKLAICVVCSSPGAYVHVSQIERRASVVTATPSVPRRAQGYPA